ncbi:phasin family protein [Paratractidigestivibacter faecalis]|uniref:phasin family protein n=1 Tax=Paratractidigestivibacter faecalis TaxID=2292441 RepID=UPI003AB21398
MAGIDIMGGLNKAFLATVGAVAITAEKSQQVVDDLVKKGELTVQQGKSLNQELSRKAKEAAQETTDGALRAFLEALSDEDRAAYAAKVAQMAADIEAAKVTVDVEDGVEEEPAAQAESAEGSAE